MRDGKGEEDEKENPVISTGWSLRPTCTRSSTSIITTTFIPLAIISYLRLNLAFDEAIQERVKHFTAVFHSSKASISFHAAKTS